MPRRARASLRRQLLDAAYLRAMLPAYPPTGNTAVGTARLVLYLRAHALRMAPAQLAWHLGRKVVLRTFKNTSRTGSAA